MGVRGTVQTVHPSYGRNSLSPWVKEQAKDYLTDCGVEITEFNGGMQWEIENSDTLMRVCDVLLHDGSQFESILSKEMRGKGHPKNLANLLIEGREACKKMGYDTIVIDWW